MFCMYCGNRLPDDALFCNKCGRRRDVVENEPATGATIFSFPPLPQASTGGVQPAIGNVPTVKGIPSTLNSSSGQNVVHNAANAAPSSSAPFAPTVAASSAPQVPSSLLNHQGHPISHPQIDHSGESHSSYYTHTGPSKPSHYTRVPDSTWQSGKGKLTGHLSRRAVLLGLTGAAAVTVAGGGIAWAILSQRHSESPSPFGSTTPASTTINPLPSTQMTLYIGSWFDHSTYALRASDGTVLWRSQGGSHSDEAMALANGIVYCGSDDQTVYALRVSDGSVLWQYQTGGILNSPPSIVNGVLYIGSWDNFLYALHASDGSVLWRYQTGWRNTLIPRSG